MLAKTALITDLPFVENKRKLWVPQRTGDYEQDAATGRRYADALINYIRLKDCPIALGHITRAITENRIYQAVEIGFFTRIGIHLIGTVPHIVATTARHIIG